MTHRPEKKEPVRQEKSTGAGAEAAERPRPAEKGGDGRNKRTSGETGRPASEPITRTTEHKGGYGGEGGAPRTSTDQRERPPQKPKQ